MDSKSGSTRVKKTVSYRFQSCCYVPRRHIKNAAGITIIEIKVAKIRPHDKARAIGDTNGSMPPRQYAVGSSPATVVVAVNIHARSRCLPAAMMQILDLVR